MEYVANKDQKEKIRGNLKQLGEFEAHVNIALPFKA